MELDFVAVLWWSGHIAGKNSVREEILQVLPGSVTSLECSR
jgi:hypothetical protein